ncbi:MAG: hypothetical protein M9936_21115 [Caldilinea sp.]|nr:hypothetical protein [Caldilineaceae bacterium]MCO5212204.1 hypothetical protein [Caldilinea sp.]
MIRTIRVIRVPSLLLPYASVHACLRPGDEIWRFATPPETWKAGAGRAGFVIVRDGAIVGGVLRCAE